MRFLLTVMRPSAEGGVNLDAEARLAIDELNDAMVQAGIRIFVGGLRPAAEAVVVLEQLIEAGPANHAPYTADGFWVVEVDSSAEAQEWASRASRACRARIEVRPFY